VDSIWPFVLPSLIAFALLAWLMHARGVRWRRSCAARFS
jgi:hypothetical protein